MHLPKIFQGPLWVHSCFGFELSMDLLKDLVKSANGVPNQIVTRVMTWSSLEALKARAIPCIQKFMNSKVETTLKTVFLFERSRKPAQAVVDLLHQTSIQLLFLWWSMTE